MKDTVLHEKCGICGKTVIIEVDLADIRKWESGTFVQDAFPYLTADEREMLVSHTCETCWDKLFPKDE